MEYIALQNLRRLAFVGFCRLFLALSLATSPATVAQYYEYDPDDLEHQATTSGRHPGRILPKGGSPVRSTFNVSWVARAGSASPPSSGSLSR